MPDLEQPKPAVKRQVYLDVLRVVAFVAVAMIHVTSQRFIHLPVDSSGWLVNTAFDSISRFAVPIFFMVSGALWLDPNRVFSFSRMWKKNILRLVTAYVFWRLVYTITFGAWREQSGLVQGAVAFVLDMIWTNDHLWFVPALIAVYLLVPFLRRIAADRKLLSYFLLLWAVFGVLVYTLDSTGLLPQTVSSVIDGVKLYFVLGYTGYFMLGYWLSTAEIKLRTRVLLYGLGGLSMAAIFGLTVLFVKRSGERIEPWLGYLTPFCLITSAAVFVEVRALYAGRELAPKRQDRIASLGKYSFGAYLVHLLFILPSQYELIPSLADLGVPYIIEVPVFTLIVVALSFAVSWVLNKIPLVNRYLV